MMSIKRTRIKESDIDNFAALLKGWSYLESSLYLRHFWRAFGMTEMQFYRRLWMAEEQIPGFKAQDIKDNLKENRKTKRDKDAKETSSKAEKISIYSQRGESYSQESSRYAQESGGL